MKKKIITLTMFLLMFFAITSNVDATSMSLSTTDVNPGQKITVNYSGASGVNRSWIGLYKTGSTDRSYISYKYIDTKTSGSLEFTVPNTAGTYEFRAFSGSAYSKIGTSNTFRISEFTPTLTVSSTSVNPGQKITVNYSGASGVNRSWIGLYKTGSTDRSYISYKYIDTKTSGSLEFTVPNTAGTYEFRIFRGSAYTKIGTGGQFTVGTISTQVLRGVGVSNGIKLDWTASSASNVVGYNLYRGTSSGNYSSTPVTDFYITDLTYTDFTGKPNTTYYYIMKPVYSNNTEGPSSNEVALRWTSNNERGKLELKIGSPYMKVNGTNVEIDPGRGTVPIIINGRTMLPIRAVVESIGGTIEWEGSTRKVTIKNEGKTIEMWIDNRTARVDGVAKELDVAPQIRNGRTMVPFRFVGESLGKEIDWEGSTRTAIMYFN